MHARTVVRWLCNQFYILRVYILCCMYGACAVHVQCVCSPHAVYFVRCFVSPIFVSFSAVMERAEDRRRTEEDTQTHTHTGTFLQLTASGLAGKAYLWSLTWTCKSCTYCCLMLPGWCLLSEHQLVPKLRSREHCPLDCVYLNCTHFHWYLFYPSQDLSLVLLSTHWHAPSAFICTEYFR